MAIWVCPLSTTVEVGSAKCLELRKSTSMCRTCARLLGKIREMEAAQEERAKEKKARPVKTLVIREYGKKG